MVGTEGFLPDRQGALEERLRLANSSAFRAKDSASAYLPWVKSVLKRLSAAVNSGDLARAGGGAPTSGHSSSKVSTMRFMISFIEGATWPEAQGCSKVKLKTSSSLRALLVVSAAQAGRG